jgi:hypothetical protein
MSEFEAASPCTIKRIWLPLIETDYSPYVCNLRDRGNIIYAAFAEQLGLPFVALR